METREATTFNQLSDFFDEFDRYGGWVYRGQSDSNWSLVPKIARVKPVRGFRLMAEEVRSRLPEITTARDKLAENLAAQAGAMESYTRELEELQAAARELERSIRILFLQFEATSFHNWKKLARRYIPDDLRNEWEWLALGQHYGLSTRLLDWTMNPLAASFFALSEDHKRDAAIYALYCTHKLDTDQSIAEFEGVAMYAPRDLDDRLYQQKAILSVASYPFDDLQRDLREPDRLTKLVIPSSSREMILRKVVSFGVDRSALFPGLDGSAAHTNWLSENSSLIADMKPGSEAKVELRRSEIKSKLNEVSRSTENLLRKLNTVLGSESG